LTFVASCVVVVRKFVLHKPDTHSLAFCCPGAEFSDFYDLSDRVVHFGEPDMLSRTDFFVPYPYPVPSIYAFLFFVRLFPRPLAAYLLFALLSFFVAAFCLSLRVKQISSGRLQQVAIWSTLLLSYPLAILLDRGNIEAVIWVLILLGVVAYARGKMLSSAILWSLAASMKIFPALLFVMFLAKRKYRVFGFAIAATATITLLALAGVGPTLRQAALDSSRSAAFIKKNYILARSNLQFDHSLLSPTKQAVHLYALRQGADEVLQHRRPPRGGLALVVPLT
jgi:Glycosyltransferase family 87